VALNSRNKGKVGELEAAAKLRELFGWDCGRSVQHSGTTDSADLRVNSTPGLWFEVKRVQALNVPKTMQKAVEQAGRKTAVLLHRRNHDEWLLTVRLKDLPSLAHAYDIAESGKVVTKEVPGNQAGAGGGSGKPAGAARRDSVERRTGTDTNHPVVRADDGGNTVRGMGASAAKRVPPPVR